MAGQLSIPPHVLDALAARGGPGPPPDPSALGGAPPLGAPAGIPAGPGADPSMSGVGMMGAPDPSTPEGATALIQPLIMAQQAQIQGQKQVQAHAMAAAMASAMANMENPAGAAASTLPGVPTAPGSDPGGDPNAGQSNAGLSGPM